MRVNESQNNCIKIERIIEFNSLPSILKIQRRRNASHRGYLWLTDVTLIINPTNIRSKIDIWLFDVKSLTNINML